MVVSDGESGHPTAVLEAAHLTGIRTAAISLLAARQLARPDARTLALIGCGFQARTHLEGLSSAFPLTTVLMISRRRETVRRFAEVSPQPAFSAGGPDPRGRVGGIAEVQHLRRQLVASRGGILPEIAERLERVDEALRGAAAKPGALGNLGQAERQGPVAESRHDAKALLDPTDEEPPVDWRTGAGLGRAGPVDNGLGGQGRTSAAEAASRL